MKFTVLASLIGICDLVLAQSNNSFCLEQGVSTIANGTQISNLVTCSLTIQGILPTLNNMVSTLIMSPANNQKITQGQTFDVIVQSININFGFFDDPGSRYYLEPQVLDENGLIIGHSHIVIQKLSDDFNEENKTLANPPSAQSFVFFKGLNQDDEGIPGRLSITVTDGIQDTGIFRICTMTSSSGHQPVLMPVARRGSQDDCVRIKVVRGRRNPLAKKVDEDVTPEELGRARKRRNSKRRRL